MTARTAAAAGARCSPVSIAPKRIVTTCAASRSRKHEPKLVLLNTSLECPTCGDEIARKIAENMGQQETAIYQVLRRAQADGTLRQTQDARALARFFLGVAWGINAVNKSVADPGVFRDMVRVAMSAWDRPAAQRKGSRLTAHGRPNDSHCF